MWRFCRVFETFCVTFSEASDMDDAGNVSFVDGRCSCCPYGYHVDLDFLRYSEALNSGA